MVIYIYRSSSGQEKSIAKLANQKVRELETAIEEGYLVPYQVVKHTTKFLRDGIKGHAFSVEEIAELEDKGIDPNSLDFEAKDIDRAIYNKDTNRKILQNLMENGQCQADGQTLGKTIIFARNHKHAKLLEELFDEIYPQYAGKFCQVIDNYDPRAEDLIDDFKGKGSNDELMILLWHSRIHGLSLTLSRFWL